MNLADNQLEKIIRASQNKQGLVVRITKDNLEGNLHKIPVTKTQINRINKAKNGLNLFLSSSQLKYLKKSSGLLPLLALLPPIFAGLGAAGDCSRGAWLPQYLLSKMLVLPLPKLQKWSVKIVKLESQLKSGANTANADNAANAANNISGRWCGQRNCFRCRI